MGKIVVKFGGSSLADAAQFRKVRDIIRMDPAPLLRGAQRARAAFSGG